MAGAQQVAGCVEAAAARSRRLSCAGQLISEELNCKLENKAFKDKKRS